MNSKWTISLISVVAGLFTISSLISVALSWMNQASDAAVAGGWAVIVVVIIGSILGIKALTLLWKGK